MTRDVLLGHDHLVIAEIAQAHDGDIAVAHALIDSASRAGAHVVKFQTHIAGAESTVREPWRVKFSKKEDSRFEYWKRMQFTLEQWRELKNHCGDCGVEFMSSPFSPQAVDLLMEVGVRIWKVASGEVANSQLLGCIAITELPVIFSSGLSTIDELRVAIQRVNRNRSEFAVLQCATQYPTSPEFVGLNVIPELLQEFGCVVGISDHTSTVFSSIAAAALGARIFEIHIRQDGDEYGPDSSSSLTESQLAELTQGVAFVRQALLSPVDKRSLSNNQKHLREIFGRSLVASQTMPKGRALTRLDVAYKKPGGGLRFEELDQLIGKTLRQNLEVDQEITLEDFEVNP